MRAIGLLLIGGWVLLGCAPRDPSAEPKVETVDVADEPEMIDLTSTDFAEEELQEVHVPGLVIEDEDPPDKP